MSSEMTIPEHFDELRHRLLRIVLCVAIVTVFSMGFGIKSFTVVVDEAGHYNANFHDQAKDSNQSQSKNGTKSVLEFFYPYPNPINNIALQLTVLMKDSLLPPEVKFIQTAPGQVFFSQIHISLLLGLICSTPLIINEIFGFISPAINLGTRKSILRIFLPVVCLLIIGIILSYIFIIPFTLDFLYQYGQSVGAETFLTVDDFISFVLQFMLGYGLSFELPIIMYGLSLSGLVDSRFWWRNFKYAAITIVIFGAVITPDGSGVTMWFVSLPMLLLYFVGIFFIKKRENKLLTT